MDDHQSNPEQSQEPVSNPQAGASQATSADAKSVPLGEHIELRQELRLLREETARLKEQLAASSKQQTAPANEQPKVDLDTRLKQLERQQLLRRLESDLDLTPKQADAVAQVMEKTPGINDQEARYLASLRHADLFETSEQASGYQPGVHGSSRPAPGNAPAPVQQGPDTEQRLAAIGKIRGSDKERYNRLLNNMVGSIAARELGMEGHQRIPIPKNQP